MCAAVCLLCIYGHPLQWQCPQPAAAVAVVVTDQCGKKAECNQGQTSSESLAGTVHSVPLESDVRDLSDTQDPVERGESNEQ